MREQQPSVKLLDYCRESASDQIVPNPAVLRSLGWSGLHLELHQQPTFATDEHHHTMHVLACGLADSSSIVHIMGADPRLRIFSLAVQFSCLVGLIGLAIL